MHISNWQTVLTDKRFWADYYFLRLETDEEETTFELLERIFGVDEDMLFAFHHSLYGFDQQTDETAGDLLIGNVLSVSLPSGYEWRIEFNTIPGSYHYLNHPSYAEPLLTGYDDPHFHLPIFRWAEVPALAAWAMKDWQGSYTVNALKPLLAPLAFLSPSDKEPATQWMEAAWRALGLLGEEQIALLVERLTWTMDIQWQYTPEIGWTTNAHHSHRHQTGAWHKQPEAFRQFEQFMTTMAQGKG